ncbi:MAG: hypothetical protein JWM95_4483 [Gemmatimonadetes bacterium]|nr:hypothetical protein [Gemmatimonadota bacterium]
MLKNMLRDIAKRFSHRVAALTYPVSLFRAGDVLIEDFLARHLHANPKYQDPKRLNRYDFQIFSQNGEDGMIQEIFRRIGTSNRFFLEFGVGNGLENNTAALLLYGWSGAWIDGDTAQIAKIRRTYAQPIGAGRLALKNAFVSAENIEQHFRDLQVPAEPDFLSIDIDGNDYWVWQAIEAYRPRVVVLEYNAHYGASLGWVQKYNPDHRWKGTSYFGVSLKALEVLGRRKGYTLVACNFFGNNAFFVRGDLVADLFFAPFTAETHFEPARFYLYRRNGLRRELGPYEIVE